MNNTYKISSIILIIVLSFFAVQASLQEVDTSGDTGTTMDIVEPQDGVVLNPDIQSIIEEKTASSTGEILSINLNVQETGQEIGLTLGEPETPTFLDNFGTEENSSTSVILSEAKNPDGGETDTGSFVADAPQDDRGKDEEDNKNNESNENLIINNNENSGDNKNNGNNNLENPTNPENLQTNEKPSNIETRPREELIKEGNEIISERTYNQDVFDLGNGQKRYEIHAANINYKDDTGNFQPIDTTLSFDSTDRAWEQTKASYECKIPEYADDWFDFYNEYEETNHLIKAKPVANHVRGEVFNGQEDGNYVIYKDAFGKGIDLKVYAYSGGLKKVIIINDKPVDTNKEMTFDFELALPDNTRVKDMTGAEWDKTGNLDFSSKTIKIGAGDKFSYFREALVWDSAYINDKVKIELIAKDNKMYLRKTIVKDILQKAVYPLYTDDVASYYAGAGDGDSSSYVSTWDGAHDATTGSATYTNTTVVVESKSTGTNYQIGRTFFPINTNSIDDGGTITAAVLYIYTAAGSNGDNDGDDWLNVVQTTQASTSQIASGDFNDCGAVNNPTEGATRIDMTGLNGSYTGWTLNDAGISWINKAGWTKLGVREGHDAIDSPIALYLDNYVRFSTSEDTSGTKDPYLSVTVTSYQPRHPASGTGTGPAMY